MKVRVLNEETVRRLISPSDAFTVVRDSMAALADGKAMLPKASDLDLVGVGEMHVKGAYLFGSRYFSYKAASGFYGNAERGLPVVSGLSMVFDAGTGFLQCLVLDNGYLTELRTGAAGAVASQLLARVDARTVGIIGSGGQARFQLEALAAARSIDAAYVYVRSADSAYRYAMEMTAKLEVPVQAVESAEEVVRRADILVTATPARTPVVKADWVAPGQHVTAMGSDVPTKNELEPEVLARADKVVVDDLSQALSSGELHHAVDRGVLSADQIHGQLGDVILGRIPGRETEDEITVADLTGLGVQDAAVVNLVVERAEHEDVGDAFEPNS